MILVSSILSITGTPSNGSLPIGNGQGFTVNTLTAGTNVTITNGPGTITIAASGGGGGTPAGSTNEIQYNNSGAFGANSNLAWDIANSRAIIGTEIVASTNSRLVVIGKSPTGTNQTFAVHNSTGTNNSLVVTDNGRIGFGALPYGGVEVFRFRSGADNNLALSSITGGTRLTSLNDANSGVQILSFGGSSFTFLTTAGFLATTINASSLTSNVKIISILNGVDIVPFEVNNANTSGGVLASIDFKQANIITSKIRSKQEVVAGGTGELQILVKSESTPSPYGLTQIATFFSNSLSIGQTTETASSILTLNSTTKGFLPPRMTNANRLAIASPAIGLIVYCTDVVEGLYVYKSTGWTFII
jgi:hypothetical protein